METGLLFGIVIIRILSLPAVTVCEPVRVVKLVAPAST